MVLVDGMNRARSMLVTGQASYSAAAGFARCGYSRCGADKEFGGIYQRKKIRSGWGTSRMRFYRPTNPQTVAQQAWRAVFVDGRMQWALLTLDEKSAYNKRARGSRITGFNLYMREYLTAHRL